MAKKLNYLMTMLLMLCMAVSMAACGDDPDGIEKQLVGTWYNGETTLVFNADHTGSITYYGYKNTFKDWTVRSSDNEVSAIFTSGVDKGKEIHLVRIKNFTGKYFTDMSDYSLYEKQ